MMVTVIAESISEEGRPGHRWTIPFVTAPSVPVTTVLFPRFPTAPRTSSLIAQPSRRENPVPGKNHAV